MDFALIAQAATLRSRIPFLHFFDGFRTSHEVQKVEELTFDDMRAMIDDKLVNAHRARGLCPGPAGDARHRPEPGRLLPGARDGQQILSAVHRPSSRRRWTSSPSSPVASTSWSSTVGATDAERVVVIMGSGGRHRPGDRGDTDCQGGEGRRRQGPPVPPLPAGRLRCGASHDRQKDRGPRPHQGARLTGRAALPGRAHRHRRGDGRRQTAALPATRPSSAAATASAPRNSPRPWPRRCSTT